MDKKECLKIILDNKYPTINDLRYNQKLGYLFSKDELEQFLSEKENLMDDSSEFIKTIPLKMFNSKHCFYVDGAYLKKNYNQYFLYTLYQNH